MFVGSACFKGCYACEGGAQLLARAQAQRVQRISSLLPNFPYFLNIFHFRGYTFIYPHHWRACRRGGTDNTHLSSSRVYFCIPASLGGVLERWSDDSHSFIFPHALRRCETAVDAHVGAQSVVLRTSSRLPLLGMTKRYNERALFITTLSASLFIRKSIVFDTAPSHSGLPCHHKMGRLLFRHKIRIPEHMFRAHDPHHGNLDICPYQHNLYK